MTISMLRGEEGGQADELDRMTAWLEQRVRPDVVHLSNALLLGLARRLKERLGARIVCSLQDEDTWVDAMRPDMAARVWNLMAERAADVDMFLPVSHRFGSSMQEQLRLPADRVRVVPLGVDTDVFVPPSSPPESPALGYVSRQCESMGLGILVEAFTKLKREPEFKSLLLWITGGATGDDRTFLAGIRQRLRDAGILADVRFVDAFDTPSRVGMLQTCMALSVPVLRGEAFGLYQLEAMACGVPVVQPALGAFPEVAERTGGGVIYEPNDAAALAGALAALLRDPERRAALRRNGLATVRKEFSLKAMARRTSDIYHELGDAHD